jgi:hypothetical protein
MIELLAAYLKLSVSEAINYLVAKGVIKSFEPEYPKRLAEYTYRQVAYRNKLLSFWTMIKGCEHRITQEHEKILTTMNIIPGSGISSQVINMFGFSNKKEVASNLMVTSFSSAADGGCNRIFNGVNWKDVCVLPSFDMPGRIKTFMFFGRPDSGSVSTAVRHVSYKKWTRHETEAGLVFLGEAVCDQDSKKIVLETDTIKGLQIAADYADRYKKMPPMALLPIDNERLTTAWSVLHQEGKEVIVTGSRAESLLSSSTSLFKSNYDDSWKNSWVGSAKWISSTILSKKENKSIVETSPLVPSKDEYQSANYNGKTFSQCLKGFTVKRDNEVIANFIVKVEKVIIKPKKSIYIGTIENSKGKARFKVNSSVFTNMQKSRNWLSNVFFSKGLGFPIYTRIYLKAFNVLPFLFNEPILAKSDVNEEPNEEMAFRLANYKIMKDGSVIKTKLFKRRIGTELCISDELNVFEKDEIGAENSALAWAMTITVMGNTVSELINKQKVGIAVSSDCFEEAKKIATTLGCFENKISRAAYQRSLINSFLEKEKSLAMPVVIDPPSKYSPMQKFTIELTPGERNCIIKMDKLTMLAARTVSRWVYISDDNLVLSEHIVSALRKITINFLSWFLRKNYRPAGNTIIEKSANALIDWCNDNGITLDGIKKGIELIDSDLRVPDSISKAEAFKSVAGQILDSSSHQIVKQYDSAKGTLAIECRAFYEMCRLRLLPVVDRATLSKVLLDTKTIEVYAKILSTQRPCWVVSKDTLEEWKNEII